MKNKTKELVVYGGINDDNEIDLFCESDDPYVHKDGNVVMFALKMADLTGGKSLLDELQKRGYDPSTVRFTIAKKQPAGNPLEHKMQKEVINNTAHPVYSRKDGSIFDIPAHLQPKIALDNFFAVAWFQYNDSSGGFFFNKETGKADAYYCNDPIYIHFIAWAKSQNIKWFSL